MVSPYVKNEANPLGLRGTMTVLHLPRFRPSDADSVQFSWWMIAICIFTTVLALLLDTLRVFLIHPWMIPFLLLVDTIRWMCRIRDGKWYLPKLSFTTLPYLTVWLIGVICPLLADLMSHRLWYAAVLSIVTWRLIRVSQKIRIHYLDYCLEHEALSSSNRERWKTFRESGWTDEGVTPGPVAPPGSAARRKLYWNSVHALQTAFKRDRWLGVSSLVAAVLIMAYFGRWSGSLAENHGQGFLISLLVIGSCVVPILLHRLWGKHLNHELAATWRALHVFCQVPPTVPVGSRAPWSARSRYGNAENRRRYLIWNFTLIGFLVISAVVLYPLVGPDRCGHVGLRYPLGGWVVARLQDPLPDMGWSTDWIWGGALIATVLAMPTYIGSGLVWLVGPSAAAGESLFENDDAIEHERPVTPPSTNNRTVQSLN